jgi:RNA polymerase-binding transcription factor DksA
METNRFLSSKIGQWKAKLEEKKNEIQNSLEKTASIKDKVTAMNQIENEFQEEVRSRLELLLLKENYEREQKILLSKLKELANMK